MEDMNSLKYRCVLKDICIGFLVEGGPRNLSEFKDLYGEAGLVAVISLESLNLIMILKDVIYPNIYGLRTLFPFYKWRNASLAFNPLACTDEEMNDLTDLVGTSCPMDVLFKDLKKAEDDSKKSTFKDAIRVAEDSIEILDTETTESIDEMSEDIDDWYMGFKNPNEFAFPDLNMKPVNKK